MPDFSQRLREELEYTGLSQKELAAKAGIQKRALDMYLGPQKSMPPADAAVKIASVLDVSVEYLVTGRTDSHKDMAKYFKLRDILDDLLILPAQALVPIRAMIKAAARQEREKTTRLS
ncbi:MAG: helix-turn-helix domain-containing protein [Dysgonamonadaceae bacterium]|jgi:transcriptional regulator with XRE-family HTH domain|nr:helix-turn-helix domain-containing protein [Dysgonamonadaceae bacterium]